jgi:hypothetical protein
MSMMRNTVGTVAALVGVLAGGAACAGQFGAESVSFAPGVEAAVRAQYGARELPLLRAQLVATMDGALKSAADRCNLSVEVMFERVAPSHPTLQQQLSNPALDPTRTHFAYGGAALEGQLRDAGGRIVTTVKDQYFTDDLRFASVGRDPWSDARIAIDQFADKLVKACERASVARPAP